MLLACRGARRGALPPGAASQRRAACAKSTYPWCCSRAVPSQRPRCAMGARCAHSCHSDAGACTLIWRGFLPSRAVCRLALLPRGRTRRPARCLTPPLTLKLGLSRAITVDFCASVGRPHLWLGAGRTRCHERVHASRCAGFDSCATASVRRSAPHKSRVREPQGALGSVALGSFAAPDWQRMQELVRAWHGTLEVRKSPRVPLCEPILIPPV